MINFIFKIFFCLLLTATTRYQALAADATLLPPGQIQFFDNNGDPLTSGWVYFYTPNTLTFKTTWQNAAKSVANTNPVHLDAAGRAIIYGDGTYRQIVKSSTFATIWDAVTASTGSSGSGTLVGDGNLVTTILPWASLTAPNQYLFAYGQEIARATYPEFYTAVTLTVNVNCTIGSPTVSGLSDTTQIPIGSVVELGCVAPGTTVISKTLTTITLSANSSLSTTAAAIFYPYGNGNGTTTFNVPDLRGRVIAGRDNMGGTAASRLTVTYCATAGTGAACGSQSNTLLTTNIPAYTPSGAINITDPGHDHAQNPNTAYDAGASDLAGGFARTTGLNTALRTVTNITGVTATFSGAGNGGNSTPYSIVQPTMSLNYVIKVTPDVSAAIADGVASLGGMTGVIACGGGLTCTGNIISSLGSSAIVVGTTTVTAGTTTKVLFDNAGVLGEYTISGTGNVAMTTSPVFTTPNLGTPSAATLTNATGLPVGGISGLGAGVATFLATPSSTNLAAAVTGETGSGSLVFNVSPTLAGPAISGIANFVGVIQFSTQTAPAQITSNQNNYNPGGVICSTTATLLLNSDANRSITGLGAGAAGCRLLIANNGSFTITLTDNSGSSSAGNRFCFGANLDIASSASGELFYDGASTCWRQTFISSTGGGGGTVTSVACSGATITTSGTCPEAFDFKNCSLSASVATNLLTVALKDNGGSNPSASSPCRIGYRSSTAATGTVTYNTQTSALSIDTNATGATLGSQNSVAFRLWVGTFDNSGTNVMFLFNASDTSDCYPAEESLVQTSVPISGTATSAGVFYTPNGTTVTGKAIRLLGYVEYNSTGLTTAGTYASGPNFIQVINDGIKKPCETVQRRQGTVTNSATTTTSTTIAATTLTKTITPKSAANRIQVSFTGTGECVGVAGSSALKMAILRGGGIVGPEFFPTYCPTLSSVQIGPATWFYMDSPNTTSSTTYAAGLGSSTSGETSIFPAAGPDSNGGGVIWLTEIQG